MKTSIDVQVRTSYGKLFQSVGAAIANAREPLEDLHFGTSRRISHSDLRLRTGKWYLISSDKYDGAIPLRILKVSSAVLKEQRCTTGSQCRDFKTGVI